MNSGLSDTVRLAESNIFGRGAGDEGIEAARANDATEFHRRIKVSPRAIERYGDVPGKSCAMYVEELHKASGSTAVDGAYG